MIDEKDLLTLAQGAAAAAETYLLECLQIDAPNTQGSNPCSDDQLASLLVAEAFTVVFLQVAMKVNIRNPELQGKIDAMIATASAEIGKKVVDKVARRGIIGPS